MADRMRVCRSALTPVQQEQMARWSQRCPPGAGDDGAGDCSRWAISSALAARFGTRPSRGGTEIALPPEVRSRLMGTAGPLHFPPTKAEIDRISAHQYNGAGVAPADGFQGVVTDMSSDLVAFGLSSVAHQSRDLAGLIDQMTSDLAAGHPVIVNGAATPATGHFVSITAMSTRYGETVYLVNDSNRGPTGEANENTIPRSAGRARLLVFLANRRAAGPDVLPGYSTLGYRLGYR